MFDSRPVTWKGVKFRSKLEASYAAFFSSLGMEWLYEPPDFTFRGWWPDFVIWPASYESLARDSYQRQNGRPADEGEQLSLMYVEVKPVHMLDRQATRALRKAQMAIIKEAMKLEWVPGRGYQSDLSFAPYLWLAPAELTSTLTGWQTRLIQEDSRLIWRPFQRASLEDIFSADLGVPLGKQGQLGLPDIDDDGADYGEVITTPDYPLFWNQATRLVDAEAMPCEKPWHPKDDPEPEHCDGGSDCVCDEDEHQCGRCGRWKKRQFELYYDCYRLEVRFGPRWVLW